MFISSIFKSNKIGLKLSMNMYFLIELHKNYSGTVLSIKF